MYADASFYYFISFAAIYFKSFIGDATYKSYGVVSYILRNTFT